MNCNEYPKNERRRTATFQRKNKEAKRRKKEEAKQKHYILSMYKNYTRAEIKEENSRK